MENLRNLGYQDSDCQPQPPRRCQVWGTKTTLESCYRTVDVPRRDTIDTRLHNVSVRVDGQPVLQSFERDRLTVTSTYNKNSDQFVVNYSVDGLNDYAAVLSPAKIKLLWC